MGEIDGHFICGRSYYKIGESMLVADVYDYSKGKKTRLAEES